MSETAIELKGVQKSFRSDFWKAPVQVLTDISFKINEGEVFGLIGPNGAGKTTTIKILMGLVRPTSGTASIFGSPVQGHQIKQWIGYLPENAYYYDFLTPEEVLDFYGRCFSLDHKTRKERSEVLLQRVGLNHARGVKLRNFSKGMLQRIGIAQALVNNPKVVILDEPMSGLDPVGRKEMRDIIVSLADQGKTILFSSHILSDVEAICEKVGIIVKGTLRAVGAIEDMVQARTKSVDVTLQGEFRGEAPEDLRKKSRMKIVGDQVYVGLDDPEQLENWISFARGKGLRLISVVPHKETLEDIFMEKISEAR